MKIPKIVALLAPLCLAAAMGPAEPESPASDRTVVPLSDPARPARIKAHTINGGITVRSYDGKDVVVEARSRAEAESEEPSGRHPGMKRLPIRSNGLRVEEENNVVTVDTESWRRAVDLTIQVPARASLELACVNDGDIVVERVQGEIEAQNVNGAVTLTSVGGSILANTTNGAVKATIVSLDPGKPLSLVTLNGDVDVTLPAATKANLNMSIGNQGEIYSDFDVATQAGTVRSSESGKREKEGRFVLKVDPIVRGAINGGGPEFTFKTFNGDIVIHKAK
jgi:DUF4097 and DUF4098 domain-containing protein YvlB